MSINNTSGKSHNKTGSPKPGEPEFLVIGKLRKPHGVHGEIAMEILTDFPERIKTGSEVFMGNDYKPLHIRNIRQHNQLLLISFEEYLDPEKASECRNQFISIPSTELPELPSGDFYHHQILGLQVYDEDGRLLGKIENILETGANDVFVIRLNEGDEILLPAIDSTIKRIDLERGELYVNILPGILPE